jgi:hypothetical protein
MRRLTELLLTSPQQDCYSNNIGTCSAIDIGCICKDENISKISCCVLSSCNQADTESE